MKDQLQQQIQQIWDLSEDPKISTCQRFRLAKDLFKLYPQTFVGFCGEQVEVHGCVGLRTTFTGGENTKTEKLK